MLDHTSRIGMSHDPIGIGNHGELAKGPPARKKMLRRGRVSRSGMDVEGERRICTFRVLYVEADGDSSEKCED